MHRDFKMKEFLPYPEQILGKKVVFRDAEILATAPRVAEVFRKTFEESGVKTD